MVGKTDRERAWGMAAERGPRLGQCLSQASWNVLQRGCHRPSTGSSGRSCL